MIGAIIGDIIGSSYQWSKVKTKKFDYFTPDTTFTDDSVLTIAVADAFLSIWDKVKDKIYESETVDIVVEHIKKYLITYTKNNPYREYGGAFYDWVHSSKDHKPYNSYGNGSAMRCSICGYLANGDIKLAKHLADLSALPTHNHPEGLKGAEAISICITLALNGYSKAIIKKYMIDHYYPEIKDMSYKYLLENYEDNVTCQGTVPQAIYCFLISKNFEDALQIAISIGGDTDTIGDMTCAIAEAFYKKIPPYIKDICMDYLTPPLLTKIKDINSKIEKLNLNN